MRRFAVAALLPPANVERLVNDLQDRLFRERALASAQALPVFAPLAALEPGFEPRTFEEALAPLREGFRIDLGMLVADGRALLLDLRLGAGGAERLDRVRAALAGAPAAAAPAAAVPLPLGPRLWLAEAASPAEAAAAAELIGGGVAPAVGFARFEYAILEVDAADGEPWWRELSWKIYGVVRTRRPRPQAGTP